MRFRVVSGGERQEDEEKQTEKDKDTETRQSSGSKYKNKNSFKEMVKSSYDYYLSIGKEKLVEEQAQSIAQRQQKIKKLIKKQRTHNSRLQKKQHLSSQQQHSQQSPVHQIIQQPNQSIEQKQQQQKLIKRKQYIRRRNKILTQPAIRKSKRNDNSYDKYFKKVSYKEWDEKKFGYDDQRIFDVLDIQGAQKNEEEKVRMNKNVTNLTNENGKSTKQNYCKIQEKIQQSYNIQPVEPSFFEKLKKLQQQTIFQNEGTYQISSAHQALLRVQKCIDEHINFRHQIRQLKSISLTHLIQYLKTHGFPTFNYHQLQWLLRINPYLYSFLTSSIGSSDGVRQSFVDNQENNGSSSNTNGKSGIYCSNMNKINIMTFKLNGIQVQNRLESTRRRMTQVYIHELMT